MQVFYLKDTVHTDAQGRQTRNERRTDLLFGVDWCRSRGVNLPTADTLALDYDKVFMSNFPVGVMGERELEGVFHDFQGEFMSEAVRSQVCSVVRRSHTSMSVGDIIVDHGHIWFCDCDGWTLIGEVS